MAELIGFKRLRQLFLFQEKVQIFKFDKPFKKKKSSFTIELVLSNNKNAEGLKYARKFKIPFVVLNYKKKENAEIKALKELIKKKIKLICLAGFMKILSVSFIRSFKGKIINIHPSLLPKYKGLSTHKRAIENHDRYSGCMCIM